ncbi:MAG: DeoR family transcriptional regulator [Muribaculaceae bacterium]|nr:DeoR family transcriptional regulator [Muribaculaceae bacterium]
MNEGLPKPTISISPSFVNLTFPYAAPLNAQTSGRKEPADKTAPLTDRQKLILKLLAENGTMRQKELGIKLGVSNRTLRRDIDYLKENGYIERDGAKKNGLWRVFCQDK